MLINSVNDTLSIDLSESWAPANISINATTKSGGVPILNYVSLWPATDNQSFYSSGGSRSNSKFGLAPDVPPGLWQFQESGGHWNQIESQSAAAPELTGNRPSSGLSASGGGSGYILGGLLAKLGVNWAVPGLLSYNLTTNSWSNDSSADVSPFGIIMSGGMRLVPNHGANGVLIVLGGAFTGPTDNPWSIGISNLRPFANISLYDVATKSWHWQLSVGATGPNDIPPSSNMFCTTGVQSGRGTYELFVYGGLNYGIFSDKDDVDIEAQAIFNHVYILSIPSFVWFRANDTSAEARIGHTCEVIGNRQMVSIGGIRPNVPPGPTGPGGLNYTDPWPQGLGIFDMVALRWTNTYDANASPYKPPNVIQDWYDQP